MSVKIRLAIAGKKNQIAYRIIATDTHTKRDGKFLEILGFYNPTSGSSDKLRIDKEKIDAWVKKGAVVTDAVKLLIEKGSLERPKKPKVKPEAATTPAAPKAAPTEETSTPTPAEEEIKPEEQKPAPAAAEEKPVAEVEKQKEPEEAPVAEVTPAKETPEPATKEPVEKTPAPASSEEPEEKS